MPYPRYILHEMQKSDVKKGLATLCIGGGMGCSTIVKMKLNFQKLN